MSCVISPGHADKCPRGCADRVACCFPVYFCPAYLSPRANSRVHLPDGPFSLTEGNHCRETEEEKKGRHQRICVLPNPGFCLRECFQPWLHPLYRPSCCRKPLAPSFQIPLGRSTVVFQVMEVALDFGYYKHYLFPRSQWWPLHVVKLPH